MAIIPVFQATVSEDGEKLLFPNGDRAWRRNYLKKLAGKRVTVTVKEWKNQRSLRQNAWHWSVAVPLIAQELGWDRHEHERLHYSLVSLCFGTTKNALGVETPNVRSSQLTTKEFSELMEWEVRWAADEHGIRIPMPSEVEFDAA